MENAKPSSSAAPYSTGAGAGGKERKPPNSRKRQSTPYDRPPRASSNNNSSNNNNNDNNNNNKSNELQHDEDGGGWLSKLVVNPARRLIVGGASRILPSFFSSSDSYCENDSYSDHDDDAQDVDTNVTENINTDGDAKHISEIGVSTCSGDAGPSNQMDNLNRSLQHNDVQQDKSENSIGDLGVDQIENLLKGKQFSRDESKRLMEILNSRLVDTSNAEREKKSSSTVFPGQAQVDVSDPPVPSKATMGNQYDVERNVLETPMPRLQSNMQDEIAASPIDIARAYMGSRTSELGYNTYTNIPADGREQQRNDFPPLRPHFLTPSSKSSTCWPGAMVQDQRGYMTPQGQRGRYGVHNFARTPYSRPKPKLNQLQGDSRLSNISLAPFQQSRTPNSSKMKTSSNVMDGGYGSVGPIRRVRNKYISEPWLEGPRSLSSAQNTSSSSVSRSFMPVFERNSATAGTSGTSTIFTTDKLEQTLKGVANSSGPSNETVRKILEQLDRHIPTPKEKEAELKLATGWKRSSSQDTDLISKGSSFLATGSDLQKCSGILIPQGIEKDPVINLNEATNTLSSVDEAGAVPLFSIKNMGAENERSTFARSKGKEKGQPWSTDNQINGQDVSKKRTFQPISPKRPDPWQVMASENGRGFTFPFAVNTSSALEPPTPSIMPSFPVTAVPQSKELPAIPLYSFGAKKSSERVVFSFPSTSSVPVDEGDSDHKFNFGSNKKRVSFASIGNDAIVTN